MFKDLTKFFVKLILISFLFFNFIKMEWWRLLYFKKTVITFIGFKDIYA